MGTNYYKQETVTPPAEITLGAHKQQKLESVIYSYDKDISKLIIPVVVPKCKELDFDNVETVKILLTVIQGGKEKKIEDTATIEKIHRRHISYIITDRLNGYQGNVKMNVYLDLKNGQQIDLAEYGFAMVRSAIDQDMPEIEDFYFKSLDDVITSLQVKADETLNQIAEASSVADQKIKDIEKQIETQNIVKNDDFNKYKNDIAATAQLKKITSDNGSQIATANGSTTLLQTILGQGIGFRAISASPAATDNPSSQALRGMALMNSSTSGNFIGLSEDGKHYSRAISSGRWVGEWAELAPKNAVQMNKVTQDNGDALIKVSDTETIIDRVIESGAGLKTGEATGKTADAPTTSNTRLIINMVNATAGSVTATDTAGVNYTRVISGSAWRDGWKRQPTAKEFEDLAVKVAALESKVK